MKRKAFQAATLATLAVGFNVFALYVLPHSSPEHHNDWLKFDQQNRIEHQKKYKFDDSGPTLPPDPIGPDPVTCSTCHLWIPTPSGFTK